MLYSVHFLRAVAAIGVVIHHASSLTGGHAWANQVGAAGVDVFFVISGVVIGASTPHDANIRDFVLRRILRVLPLYWIATAAVIAWQTCWGTPPSASAVIRSLLLIPSLGADWGLLYFPAWSLVFEMLFYLAFAACLAVRSDVKALCAATVIIAALLLQRPDSAFLSHSILCAEFAAGLAIAALIERKILPTKVTGAALLAIAMAWFAALTIQGGIPRLAIWGVPSALLVYGLLAFESAHFLRSAPAIMLGHASYAIYLSHILVIELMKVVLNTAEHRSVATLIMIAASIGVGLLVHQRVEQPLLAMLRARLLKRRLTTEAAREAVT